METCPECQGKGKIKYQVTEYWEDPVIYEDEECATCQGEGEITDLSFAIYKAKGE